jgi:hypothetical protein
MKFIDILNITKKVRFKISSIIFTIIVIFIFFGIRIFSVNITDPFPHITPYVPQEESATTKQTAEVYVGFFITDFLEFNIVKNNFVVDCVVWMLFNPHQVSLKRLEHFTFKKGEIIQKEKATTKIIGNKIFVRNVLRAKFKTDLNYKFFPLEDHHISIIFRNMYVTPEEVRFISKLSWFDIDKNIYTHNWVQDKKSIKYGSSTFETDKFDKKKNVSYPEIVFNIVFKKAGIRRAFVLLLPLILVFFLGLLSFVIDIQEGTKVVLSLSIGSLTALLAYRYVIESMSPKVGYFTVIDSIYIIIIICSFISFFINIYTTHWIRKKTAKKKDTVDAEKRILQIRYVRSSIFLTILFIIMISFYIVLF